MRILKKEVWPYRVCLPQIDLAAGEILKVKEDPAAWCKENAGRRFRDWYSYFQTNNGTIIYAFKDAKTAMIFKIRWGGK